MTPHLALVLPYAVAAATFAAVAAAYPAVPVRLPGRAGTAGVLRAVDAIHARHLARRTAAVLADDIPDVVDLLVVAARAGANVRLAVEAAARRHEGPAAAVLRDALNRARGGLRVGDALSAALGSLDVAAAAAVRPLVAVLVDSDRYGTPLAASLERVSRDLRIERRQRAEARARRLPVRLLLPLVLCVLPAFALLTVAPLLAGVARGALADAPSIPLDDIQTKEFP